MNKAKKLIAALLSAVMMITVLPMTVSAESIFKTAKNIENNKSVSVKLRKDETVSYKFTASKSGKADVIFTSESEKFDINIYDENGKEIKLEVKVDSGYYSYSLKYFSWNRDIESGKVTFTWDVKGGDSYYIRIKNDTDIGTGKFKLTCKYPSSGKSSGSSSSVSSSSSSTLLTLTLDKGEYAQLGAVKSGAKFTSSDPSVASVTSGGLVKAKKKGSAVITVKCGSESQSIKIIVE